MRYLVALSLIFSFLLGSTLLEAAPPKKSNRPRIGLVLGGGGARGAAHIGILKVLEKNRIPIDFIAGTSMGTIIGGGYASGLSPEEIQETVLSINWKENLSDNPSRKNLSVRGKFDLRRFIPFEFGFKGSRNILPQGAVSGEKIEFIFNTMTLHTVGIEHFDELKIPFRAIATNIVTGEEVVIEKGSLSDAIRASMAVPGAFSPIEIDGKLLVDGYVVNNVPVDVVQEMGADVLIVVAVGTPLLKRDEINSLFAVSSQASVIQTEQNVLAQLDKMGPKDILIRPDLGEISSGDFDRCAEAIEMGERAAQEIVGKLKALSVSQEEYAQYLAYHRKSSEEDLQIDFVRIKPSERVPEEVIAAKVKTKPGALDLDILQDDLTRIHSIGDFEKVGFRLVEEEGQTGIIIEPKEKAWGPNYLRLGFNAVDNFEGDSYYNALVDIRFTQLNDLGGEWKNMFGIGREALIVTEFYQPLDVAHIFFLEPYVGWWQDIVDIYDEGDRTAEYRTRKFGGGGDVGINFGTVAELRAGFFRGTIDAEPSTGRTDLPEFDIDRSSFHTQFIYDQLDAVYFPKNGFRSQTALILEREWLGAEDSYEKIEINLAFAKTFGKHTFLGFGELGVNPNDDLPFYDEFTLGGFLSLSGLRSDELRGKQKGAIRLIYYYKVVDKFASLFQGLYVGGSLEGGNVWDKVDEISFSDLRYGGSIFVGVETLIGPLYISYGLNEDADDSGEFYLYLGQIF